ncbi:hypothetical protein KY360_04965, partial [Candidatus Woesearchaeota archaeon]|nr:hypothetical protein [Candidatus Woesearchaeota archaeon]
MSDKLSPLEDVLKEVKSRNKAAANLPPNVLADDSILRIIALFYLSPYETDPQELWKFMSQQVPDLYKD